MVSRTPEISLDFRGSHKTSLEILQMEHGVLKLILLVDTHCIDEEFHRRASS